MTRCQKIWEDGRKSEDEKIWRWEGAKMRRCEDVRGCEKIWRWEDVRRCEDEKCEKMWRWEDVKIRRCGKMWEDVKMRRCDDRPPLLEEPFAQTLSGVKCLIILRFPSWDFMFMWQAAPCSHRTCNKQVAGKALHHSSQSGRSTQRRRTACAFRRSARESKARREQWHVAWSCTIYLPRKAEQPAS